MYCQKCGNQVNDNDQFCPSCGAPTNSATINRETQNYNQNNGDESNLGYAILGFFIPIAGIILYFVWKSEFPLKARSCMRGFMVGVAVYVVGICCLIATAGAVAGTSRHSYYYDVVEIVEN